jgi:hypothetical protein
VFNGGVKRPGGGHVGFVVAQDHQNRLMVLGGNQSNAGGEGSVALGDGSDATGGAGSVALGNGSNATGRTGCGIDLW